MTFRLSLISRTNLIGVHPDLVRVIEIAIKVTEQDFRVLEGVRTLARQQQLYAKGRSTADMIAAGIHDVPGKPRAAQVTWTLNSNHFANPATGLGHAVDVVALVSGVPQWSPHDLYTHIAKAMKKAALDLGGIPVEWGFDLWNKDAGHFQLPKTYKASA